MGKGRVKGEREGEERVWEKERRWKILIELHRIMLCLMYFSARRWTRKRVCTCMYGGMYGRTDGRTVKRVGRTFVRFEKTAGQMYRTENVRTYGRTHGGVSTVHLIGYSAVKYVHTQRSKLKSCSLPCKDRSKYVRVHARTCVHVYVHG